ncbi:sensor histidine kinase [Tautonia rosea]|uniref:sensor histidine kinase n=1 Tax=Tautonia rosea TaxID=2728037 RepID=UPI0014749EB3|nr:PAS domain S-box protein [Tautonia rosea]
MEQSRNDEHWTNVNAIVESVLDALPAHVCLLDAEGTIVAINRRWEQFARENDGDLQRCGLGVNYLEVCRRAAEQGVALAAEALEGIRDVMSGRLESFTLEAPCHRSGKNRWFLMLVAPLHFDHQGLIISHVDITYQKEAEFALHESEDRLRTVIESAAEGIVSMNKDGIVDSLNAAAEQLCGYTRSEVIGKKISIWIPSLPEALNEEGLERLRSKEPGRVAGRVPLMLLQRKDGSSVPVELSISKVDDLDLYTVIIRDLSERRAMQEQLLTIAEQEQRRIGQDLHDNVGQELTGLALMVESLVEATEEMDSSESKLVERIREGLQRVQEGMRNLSRGLIPVEVDAEGLMSALSELATRIGSNHELTCRFECRETVRVENNQAATQLYRIAQEAVSNAVRHAHPRQIVIRLTYERDQVLLEIWDDGTGLWHPDEQPGEGIGLKIMRSRAELIGAQLQIESREGLGTRVVCTVQGRIVHGERAEPQ